MLTGSASVKSSILWGIPALSVALGYLALWLPWAIVEAQPLNGVEQSSEQITTEEHVLAYELEDFKVRTAVWPSASQERLFEIVAAVGMRVRYLFLPALFSLYYLFLYQLKRTPVGLLAVVLSIGIMWLAIDLPRIAQTILAIEPSNDMFSLWRVTYVGYVAPVCILVAVSFLLGLLSVFICLRTKLHQKV